MRKVLSVALFLVVAFAACGQNVVYKDSATLQWDVVATDANGDPLLPTDVVEYEVYIYDYTVGVANPQDTAQLTYIGITGALEQLVTFPHRTGWAAGVRAMVTDSGANVNYSLIAWSYIPADADLVSGPFIYSPLGTPAQPLGLQDSGT